MTQSPPSRGAWLSVLATAMLAGALTLWVLRTSAAPFVWIGVAWAAVLIWSVRVSTRMWMKAAAVNLAVVLLGLAGFEFYLFWGGSPGSDEAPLDSRIPGA